MARTELLTLPVTEEAPPDPSGGSIFFIGTATVILRYAGFTILTDPNFLHAGDHVHLGYGTAVRLYVSGDTLLREHLREIPRRYPDIDIGLFHLGGTRVLGILLSMDAVQGVEAIKLIGPREAVPIHYDDYDVFKSPFSDLKREVEKAGLTRRVRYLGRGETYRFEVPAERLSL